MRADCGGYPRQAPRAKPRPPEAAPARGRARQRPLAPSAPPPPRCEARPALRGGARTRPGGPSCGRRPLGLGVGSQEVVSYLRACSPLVVRARPLPLRECAWLACDERLLRSPVRPAYRAILHVSIVHSCVPTMRSRPTRCARGRRASGVPRGPRRDGRGPGMGARPSPRARPRGSDAGGPKASRQRTPRPRALNASPGRTPHARRAHPRPRLGER